MPKVNIARKYNEVLSNQSLVERLRFIRDEFDTPVFTTNFSTEDQIITWAIASTTRLIKVAALDIGAFSNNDKALIDITKERYALAIDIVKPHHSNLMGDADAWITGLRRGQSDSHSFVPLVEWDHMHQVMKFNPLADWSEKQVLEAVAAHEIPVNHVVLSKAASIDEQPLHKMPTELYEIKFAEMQEA